jgi:hypothetical protein
MNKKEIPEGSITHFLMRLSGCLTLLLQDCQLTVIMHITTMAMMTNIPTFKGA